MSSRGCVKNRRRNEPLSPPVPNLPALICTLLGPWLFVLAPNQSFWEEYRRGGPPPVEINFMGLPVAPTQQPLVAPEGEVSESLAAEPEEDDGAGEEVDLTLTL